MRILPDWMLRYISAERLAELNITGLGEGRLKELLYVQNNEKGTKARLRNVSVEQLQVILGKLPSYLKDLALSLRAS